MKGWIKSLVKFLFVVSMVVGTSGIIVHASESASDIAHHHSPCQVCAVYQTFSNGLTALPVLVALVLAVAMVCAHRLGEQELTGMDLLTVSFGLDPPPVILNA